MVLVRDDVEEAFTAQREGPVAARPELALLSGVDGPHVEAGFGGRHAGEECEGEHR